MKYCTLIDYLRLVEDSNSTEEFTDLKVYDTQKQAEAALDLNLQTILKESQDYGRSIGKTVFVSFPRACVVEAEYISED